MLTAYWSHSKFHGDLVGMCSNSTGDFVHVGNHLYGVKAPWIGKGVVTSMNSYRSLFCPFCKGSDNVLDLSHCLSMSVFYWPKYRFLHICLTLLYSTPLLGDKANM